MKKLIIGLLLLVGFNGWGQVSVFDCNNYTKTLTQTELDAADTNFFNSCYEMGINSSVTLQGDAYKIIEASSQIHLKDSVHLGAFTNSGQTHLLISDTTDFDVVVMNYDSLDAVLRYKKLEFGIPLPAEIEDKISNFINDTGTDSLQLNPFLEWDIDVEATFYNPWGQTVNGFYTREYQQNPQTHDWDDIGTDYPFRIRFAPPKNGEWKAQVVIKVKGQVAYKSNIFFFNVIESGDPGYVHVHENNRNLKRGNKMIFPVGQNFPTPSAPCLPWKGACFFDIDDTHKGDSIMHVNQGDTTYTIDTIYYGHNLFAYDNTEKTANTVAWNNYLEMLEQYLQMGNPGSIKYFRTVQTPYSSLIEFEEKGNYYKRLHYAAETDKILELCEQYNALFQFNFMIQEPMMKYANYDMWLWDWDHYDQNGTLTDSLWHYNYPVYCYNDDPSYLKSDGTKYHGSKKPFEMFLNESDLAYHKQRIRYYIARYGYSTKIYEFEILSEPWHLSEGWINGQSNQGGNAPFLNKTHPEHTPVRSAVYNYHKVISEYIKDSLNHKKHLVGIDMANDLKDSHGGLDQSIGLSSIDVVGFNPYYNAPNELIKSSTNTMKGYVDNINFLRNIYGLNPVPVIIPEGGTSSDYHGCSNYTQDLVDKMTLPFTGIAGYNSWIGYDPIKFSHENDVVTMPNYIYDMWDNTIRVKNHMNGNDVINTLGEGGGYWSHGMEKTFIKFVSGPFQNDKPELLEQQNYISSDKTQFVGYVRNRAYNARTRGCSNLTFSLINYKEHFYLPYSIPWDRQALGNRLKVDGLQNGEHYSIDWYSFKNGAYIKTDCLKATNGKIRLEFPKLTASYSDTTDNPVVWFVAEKSSCNQNKSADFDDSTETFPDRSKLNKEKQNMIYPNPFENFFIVSSQQDDVFILQSPDGTTIGEYKVTKGETRITKTLSNGLYIGRMQKQRQTFKIVKQ